MNRTPYAGPTAGPPPVLQLILRILAWTLALALLAEGCRGVWEYREGMDLPGLRGGIR